ncbi:hypothetical protein J4471_00020 [Candidatus Woesearchaeota archaeon]|nr:hypothetical protein [Candidatus Woesearchaeota archaeon]
MGGSIGVTVREENGKEHRMCRWTNTLPWFITNLRFLNKDPKHLEAYLEQWNIMKADYDNHKNEWESIKQKYGRDAWNHEPFENNMTGCYAPYAFLAPQGYGLVVVDMQKDIVLDFQGYTSLDTIHGVSIASDMSSVAPGLHEFVIGGQQTKKLSKKAFYLKNDFLNSVRFRELFEAGRITKAIMDIRYPDKLISLNGKSLNDTIDLLENDVEKFLQFPINMSPYEVIKYKEHNSKEAQRMQVKIKELGFTLSDEEESMWDEWIESTSG